VGFQYADWRGLPRTETVTIEGVESLAGSIESQRLLRQQADR
jgi:hypothetical protein